MSVNHPEKFECGDIVFICIDGGRFVQTRETVQEGVNVGYSS